MIRVRRMNDVINLKMIKFLKVYLNVIIKIDTEAHVYPKFALRSEEGTNCTARCGTKTNMCKSKLLTKHL